MPPTPPPDEPSSNALVRNNGGSPFQTTLDVTNAGQVIFNISWAMMSNLAKNRIDTQAYTVALAVGNLLNWHEKGRERLEHALSDSENGLVNSVNLLLKFGINAAGFSKQLLQTDDGQCFAALCASLCECYSVDWTAKIMLQLIKKIIDENQDHQVLSQMHLPSLQAITALVERFCGLFATSGFGVMVEEYMSHDGHGMVTGLCRARSAHSRTPKSRGIASPKHIADALYEVFQLSRDKSRKVQFVGGADAVAVAAVGVWLVDLPTSFYRAGNDHPNMVASTDHNPDLDPRVVVLFSENATDSTALVQGRLVYLPPFAEIVRNKSLNPAHRVSGRLYWHNALSVTFGDSFKRLIKMGSNFGPALGSAARVFQAFVDGDENVPDEWRAACQTYYKDSSGLDYVIFALQTFQELRTPIMESTAREFARKRTYIEAEREFESSMFAIADFCSCKYCCFNGKPTPKRNAAAATNNTEPVGSYCLVALSNTIIRLIRVLSGIDFPNKRLFLNRSGLECFYNQQHDRLMIQRKGARDTAKDNLFIYRVVEHVKVDKAAPEYSPLCVANTLFSGHQLDKDIQLNTSAFAAQGICSFFSILQRREPREASAISRVCVIPGSIEYRGQTYAGIGDLGSYQYRDTSPLRYPPRPAYCVSEKVRKHTQICLGGELHLVIDEQLVDQRNPWLEVGFELLGQEGMISLLGPAKIVENTSKGTGVVSCRRSSRCDDNRDLADAIAEALPLSSPEESWVELGYGRSTVFVFRGDTPTAFIVAQGCWQPLFLTGQDCVACAIRTGVSQSWPNFAVVCSSESFTKASRFFQSVVSVS